MHSSTSRESSKCFGLTRNATLACGLALIVLTAIVYWPAAHHGFINYDDDRYVTENPQVQSGLRWSTVTWAFTTFEQANWHPLTWLSHALDCQLFHLNPAGHHADSILLHCLNALLLFLILHWFTGSTFRSLTVAALFAVHPLNVESVAWVAERKTVLSMLFFLLAVAAYGWYVVNPSVQRYLAMAVCFAVALMCKPMVITLPFVLLLLDFWPLGRLQLGSRSAPSGQGAGVELRFAPVTVPFDKLCLEKVPLLLLSAASAAVTKKVQSFGGAVASSNRVAPLQRIGNAILSYVLYLKKMVWPVDLVIFYPHPLTLPVGAVAIPALVLIAISALALRYGLRSRYLAVGWLWYLGTLVPMIGLVQVGNQSMADRYAYLPLIGIFVMVVWAAADWFTPRDIAPKFLAALAVAVTIAYASETRVQLTYWRDDFKLWTRTLALTSNNFVAENNLGVALMRHGRREEGLAHFRAAAAIEPEDSGSQFNLAVYAQEQGDFQAAIPYYEAVIRLTGDTQLRASACANLGTTYFALRDYTRAVQYFDCALKLNPSFPLVVRDMGLIAAKNNDARGAVSYFSWLVNLDPSDVNFFLLAQAFHAAGRDGDAMWAYGQATHLSKDMNVTREMANQFRAL